ncbi:methyltransferase domain-containing protein [Dactylosporangium aurantiacum]|uniref:Methyltransferase domain-containing protein n=1 Tax=Dactylosporangium aurantiacum TaxID=35754 RepID=A0A9Q9IMY8_9ACTN|nr:methyltransferase domain-containing protein [Dactylosporangium aurantiacum]MDG6104068.1 methyltransferase domain-containing protein [Dactylosporangium aurantiacum]UWZ56915.1 methyltransferase domain-containing protein [Dactylosporangium aurantiacum]
MEPAAFWQAAAPGWIRHADRHDVRARPLGEVALRALAVRPGERVLDVGCGCGGTTAELAAAAGPAGAAVGVDLSVAMIDAARARFPGPRFVAADIEAVDAVPGGPFDAAYSRMVLMLLADPVAGCATVRRCLRPGGRLAATVFRAGPGNAWLPAAMLGAAPHLGALPPLPVGAEPGPFALADPERIARVLAAAGFTDVAAEPHDVVMTAPDDPDDVAEWLIELGPAGAPYRQATPDAQAAARGGAARLLARFREPGTGYRIPSALWLVTARTAGPA